MHKFLVCPTDQSASSTEITAANAAPALDVLSRLDCSEADVLQDGTYLFSVRKSGSANFWHIFQRAGSHEVVSELG